MSDLDTLLRTLALPDVAMDRLPQFQTISVASATWAAIMKVAESIQDLRFESKDDHQQARTRNPRPSEKEHEHVCD